MPTLERRDAVFLLDLGDGENRFNAASVQEIEACLDEIEGQSPGALVTTATGKFWSNGLDLEWMSTQGDQAVAFVARVQELLARFLEIGVHSVAAIQGHAFAAGAMLALAHDERVMRADRGFFCFPEVDLRIPFSEGMSSLMTARLPNAVAHEAMTTGRRYGGAVAADTAIVAEGVSEHEVLSRAIARAAALADKDPATLSAIKRSLYRDALEALRTPPSL